MADKLLKGEFHELKEIMGKSRELGMRTFDYSLFELYDNGVIAYDEAIRNADSRQRAAPEHQAQQQASPPPVAITRHLPSIELILPFWRYFARMKYDNCLL